MILEDMISQYKILSFIKNELTNRGHNYKELAGINAQLDLLNQFIKCESFNILDELLRKTNYRLLKSIDKGMNNLVEIYNNPYEWQLGSLENNNQELFNTEALIFSTERQILVFSKNIEGHRYLNNKWQ
jgi:hypothetical protein